MAEGSWLGGGRAFVELNSNGAFERGQGLAQVSLEADDLELEPEHLLPGGVEAQEIERPGGVVPGGDLARLLALGRMLSLSRSMVSRWASASA